MGQRQLSLLSPCGRAAPREGAPALPGETVALHKFNGAFRLIFFQTRAVFQIVDDPDAQSIGMYAGLLVFFGCELNKTQFQV